MACWRFFINRSLESIFPNTNLSSRCKSFILYLSLPSFSFGCLLRLYLKLSPSSLFANPKLRPQFQFFSFSFNSRIFCLCACCLFDIVVSLWWCAFPLFAYLWCALQLLFERYTALKDLHFASYAYVLYFFLQTSAFSIFLHFATFASGFLFNLIRSLCSRCTVIAVQIFLLEILAGLVGN